MFGDVDLGWSLHFFFFNINADSDTGAEGFGEVSGSEKKKKKFAWLYIAGLWLPSEMLPLPPASRFE